VSHVVLYCVKGSMCESVNLEQCFHDLEKFIMERSTEATYWRWRIRRMLKHADLFPAVRHAISIALTLPVTTCTAERSFSLVLCEE